MQGAVVRLSESIQIMHQQSPTPNAGTKKQRCGFAVP